MAWYTLGDQSRLHDLVSAPAGAGARAQVATTPYPDGEPRIDLTVRPGDLTIIAASIYDAGTGQFDMMRFWGLLAAGTAARQHGSTRVVAVVPELPCLRQDRPTTGTVELVGREWVARLLDASDLDAVVTMYPKADFAGLLKRCVLGSVPTDSMATTVARALRSLGVGIDDVLSPDAGARPIADAFARQLHCRAGHLDKRRLSVDTVVLAADGRRIAPGGTTLIVDDMYVSGGTLLSAVQRAAATGPVWAFIANFRPTALGRVRLDALRATERFEGLLVPAHCVPDTVDARLRPVPFTSTIDSVLTRTLESIDQRVLGA
jgi:phosphoribosylpyrophosphate synthetase